MSAARPRKPRTPPALLFKIGRNAFRYIPEIWECESSDEMLRVMRRIIADGTSGTGSLSEREDPEVIKQFLTRNGYSPE